MAFSPAGRSGMVSIITPVFNAERYLKLTCESVLAQTWPDFEHILVDDLSADASRDIAEVYAARDSRVRLLFLDENGGPARARNRGVEISQGEYIAFLDSDDLWASQKLERQMAQFQGRREVGIIGTNGRVIDSEGNYLPSRLFASSKILRGRVSLADFLLKGVPLATSSVMVRRECLNQCGMFKEIYRIGEDYELWMRILQSFEVDILDEELLYYRRHTNNVSGNVLASRACKVQIFENEVMPNISRLESASDEFLLKLQKMYTTLGKLYMQQGDKEQADANLGKALSLSCSLSVTFRAWCYRVWNRLG